jgi:4-hydroxy-2-oxoheptanedioate aldolase
VNDLERKMVQQLQDLRENHHVIGVKAEFEAEGTRLEEAIRLKEVITAAGLGLTMKVGGCEALRDMYEARVIGVDRVVGPMVESSWAFHKYVQAVQMAFPVEERHEVQFCINVETVTGFENFDAMLQLDDMRDLDGVVLGRVDMTGSMGLTREDVNSEPVFGLASELFTKAKAAGLECALGGGVSADSLDFMRRLPEGCLDRYETRKVVFGCPAALGDEADKGILKAVGFELMWLKNKRDFYGCIFDEDRTRIEMLQGRYDRLIELAGGLYE